MPAPVPSPVNETPKFDPASMPTPRAAEPSLPPPVNAEPVGQLDKPAPAEGTPRPIPTSITQEVQPAGARPAPRPTSDSYLEEEYRLRTGDDFVAVCRQFRLPEKYAQALQQYNQDYPIASPAMRQNPPRITAGTVIWIPPIRILEKRYAQLIPDFKALPGQTTSASPAVADAPAWTTANSAARPIANGPGYKTYRVQDGGETMQDIARRNLGNAQTWIEIYRLNPQLNPNATTPIAEGTLLRLPGR
jgi:hypothetical protein